MKNREKSTPTLVSSDLLDGKKSHFICGVLLWAIICFQIINFSDLHSDGDHQTQGAYRGLKMS